MGEYVISFIYASILCCVGLVSLHIANNNKDDNDTSRQIGISALVASVITLVGCFVAIYIGNDNLNTFFYIVPATLLGLFTIVKSMFSKRKTAKKQEYIPIVITLLFAICITFTVIYYGQRVNISFENDYCQISGLYSDKIEYKDIRKIEIVNQLPEISYRKNGFSLGKVQNGYFKTTEGKTVKLYIYAEDEKIIRISQSNDKNIYICMHDSNLTNDVYETLISKQQINNNNRNYD